MEFNTPIGNCSFNESLVERIYAFNPKTACVQLFNRSYADMDVKALAKDSVFYFDPPYFITNATYNDGKRGFVGWNADEETKSAKASEYAALQNNVVSAAKRGYVDQIVEPADTRKYVIGAFEMLYSKMEERPYKKHSTK